MVLPLIVAFTNVDRNPEYGANLFKHNLVEDVLPAMEPSMRQLQVLIIAD